MLPPPHFNRCPPCFPAQEDMSSLIQREMGRDYPQVRGGRGGQGAGEGGQGFQVKEGGGRGVETTLG